LNKTVFVNFANVRPSFYSPQFWWNNIKEMDLFRTLLRKYILLKLN